MLNEDSFQNKFRLPVTAQGFSTYLNPKTDKDPAMLPFFPAFHIGETPDQTRCSVTIQHGNVSLHLPQRLALSSNNSACYRNLVSALLPTAYPALYVGQRAQPVPLESITNWLQDCLYTIWALLITMVPWCCSLRPGCCWSLGVLLLRVEAVPSSVKLEKAKSIPGPFLTSENRG